MTAVNGHQPTAPPDPRHHVARAVYAENIEPGDIPFDELDEEEQQALVDLAEVHITSHLAFLTEHGFRLVPVGAALRPKSDDEAAAMLQAVRLYHDAKGRKGGLVGSVAPKKLILPKNHH